MSRTYKDKSWKLRYPRYDVDYEFIKVPLNSGDFSYCTIYNKTTKPKKRKTVDTEYRWLRGTPSWWVREFMTVPKRAACRNWEKTRNLDNLEEDCPDYGNKPHIYYW